MTITNPTVDAVASYPPPRLPVWEFVCIVAGLMATNALAIDIMLPALADMQEHFRLEDDNARQQVIVIYVLGLGLSQLFYGPLIDRYGRKPILGASLLVYVCAAATCLIAPSFTSLLIARFVQGAAAGATRVVAQAVVRDFYSGRRMAEIMSIIMIVFMAAPIFAPSIGQGILLVFDHWQSVFWGLTIYAAVLGVWAMLRLPETLKPEHRRPLNPKSVIDTYKTVFNCRIAAGYMLASAFIFSTLFSYISASEQIYRDYFGIGSSFPLWFAGIAGCMGISSFSNSKIVRRFGMRKLSHTALAVMVVVNVLHAIVTLLGWESFFSFYAMMMISFLAMGFVGPNFSATALEPLGNLAGTAASLYGFATTFGAGLIGGWIGSQFDGGLSGIFIGNALCMIVAFALVYYTEKGKLFVSSESA